MNELLPYCRSDEQRRLIEAVINHGGNVTHAIRELGINDRTARRSIQRVKLYAAQSGYSPEHDMTHTSPEGYHVRGVSTLYDADGKVSAQWVKTQVTPESKLAALHEAIDAVVEQYRGTAKPVKPPKKTVDDALTAIPVGDAHIGLYAWKNETGENYDLKIARSDLLSAASRLVSVSPPTKECLIINVGDFYHADGLDSATRKNKNPLDVDGRWPKVLTSGCMLMVDLIELCLRKHEKVSLINAVGNHDDHSSIMLNAFCEAFFHNEPRVSVLPNASKFIYFEYGKNLIGVTHGDTVKLTELASLMASDQPDAWGRTEHRYWYTGHIHHTSKTELRGCVVESFRTLAAKDAWHTAQGYRSGRDMYSIVLDKEYGEVERYRCDIRMARRT